ncbi:hypothetical protein TSUD_198410 [Trifolium subterraneum]|uniref:Uncharacterized protein n=1 Tax=Trifolium subterraneum TaxID=3900 RepID=A0A2Z6NSF3_TRISU|nr:hypothetical protein TSUD_198410 [Trifolium subterraneum]
MKGALDTQRSLLVVKIYYTFEEGISYLYNQGSTLTGSSRPHRIIDVVMLYCAEAWVVSGA